MKKEFTFSYAHLISTKELNEDQITALEAADKACETAYSPYSKFKVGAALLLNDGTLILGSNQENKAYPSGLCAERVALFSYGAQQKKQGIKILAISGGGDLLQADQFFTPCGGCRQVMAEYAEMQNTPFEIIMKNGEDNYLIFESIQHLLPFVFGSK